MSGFVLVGTGLALGGFGYWLSGNANCDAADLGRACVMASLGTAVIGGALGVGGWLRLKRLGGGDEGSQRESAGPLPVIAILAIAVVGIVLLNVVSPYATLPVDVYSHPEPDAAAAPQSFLPADLAGHARVSVVVAPGERPGSVVAVATYGGEVAVRITRFNESISGEIAGATMSADHYLDSLYAGLDRSRGPSACASPGVEHWFTHEGGGRATLGWQRQNFVVQVTAPATSTRDAVAGALPI